MIGVIIIILSFIAVVMLLSPVTISVNSARSGGKINGFLSLGWIMFLFRYRLKDQQTEILVLGRRVVGLTHNEKPPDKEIEKSVEVKKSGKMPHLEDILYLSRPILRLCKDLIYSFRIKYLDIDLTFGFKDPASTGILTGFLHSIPFLRASHTIRWTPDFTREVMEWDLRAKAAITPLQILVNIIRFITNRKVLRSGLRIIRD